MHLDLFGQDSIQDFIKKEYQISSIKKHLQNWNIPKESKKNIYQIGIFDRWMNYSIKTIEQALPINLQVQIIDRIQPGQINKFK
jgi:hypothetical protein